MALLNTFSVNSSSIKEQFSRRERLRVSSMPYLLTSRPCREKFQQMTERMARMSLRREEFWSSSQSMRKTVTRNLRVKGKQNLGFSRMSSAIRERVYSIRNSMFWSWVSSFQGRGTGTYRERPSRVKWFIIFLIRSTCVMNTDVYPFWNRWFTPSRHCSKSSPSAPRITSASWPIALAASVSSAAALIESMRNSNGGFSRMMGKQEAQDQLDPDEVMVFERERLEQNQKQLYAISKHYSFIDCTQPQPQPSPNSILYTPNFFESQKRHKLKPFLQPFHSTCKLYFPVSKDVVMMTKFLFKQSQNDESGRQLN